MSEPPTIIAMSTASHPPRVPGSTREFCKVCGEEVWCSPATRAVAPVVEFLCMDCATGVIMTSIDRELMQPTLGQLREIRENWSRNPTTGGTDA
jgi:hypothetical protein